MAGLPWIQVAVDLPRNPKSWSLGLSLQDDRAWAYMVQLWCWSSENLPEGRFDGPHAVTILERAAGWKGDLGAFAAAARAVGFIDEDGTALVLHGWEERAENHREFREKANKRLKTWRRSKGNQKPDETRFKGVSHPVSSAFRNADETLVKRARNADETCVRKNENDKEEVILKTPLPPVSEKPPAPRPKPAPRIGDGLVGDDFRETKAHWIAAFKANREGAEYSFDGLAAKKLNEVLSSGLPTSEICKRIDRFFADPWCRERAELGLFRTKLAALVADAARPSAGPSFYSPAERQAAKSRDSWLPFLSGEEKEQRLDEIGKLSIEGGVPFAEAERRVDAVWRERAVSRGKEARAG